MKSSISGKVMLIYGIVFMVIITLTFWLSYRGTVGRLERDLTDTNLALLKQVDQKMEAAFRQTEKDLLTLTDQLEFVYFMYSSYTEDSQRYTNFYGLNEKLKAFINSNPNFSSIFLYSEASGDIFTDKAFMKAASSEENWLKAYIDMPEYLKWLTTHQVWDGFGNQDVVTLVRSYPTISSPGYRKGVVAVNIKEEVLYNMVKAVYEDGKVGHLFVIDKDGNVVTHDDKTQIYRNMQELPYIKNALSVKGAGAFTVRLDGVDQTVFHRYSDYTGWTMISIVPEAQIYKPLQVTRNLLLVFAAAMLALALIVVIYVNRWTYKPLDRLVGKVSGAYRSGQPNKSGMKAFGLRDLEQVFDQMVLDQEHLERHVRDSKPVLKWKIMMDMLTGYRTDYQSVRHHLEFVGVRLFPERYLVCTAEVSKEGEAMTPRDETLYTFAFCNVAEELINSECAGAAIDLGGGRAAVIFSFAEGDAEQNHLRTLAILEMILDVMKKQFHLNVTVGVGRSCKDVLHIPVSYDESRKALHYKMVFGHHSVISIEDLQSPDSQDYYRLNRMVEPIMEALKSADPEKLRRSLGELYQAAVESNLPPDLLRQLSFDMIMKSLQAAGAIGVEPDESVGALDSIYEKISRCENWKEAEKLVWSVLEELAAKIDEKRSHRGKNETVERMLTYIQEHYHESDLSLDRLAEQFHLTPTYISKLFKEYTEHNFIDHLIDTRIDASKSLLLDKERKVNEISEAVGYTNTRSFLRTFKKYTGMTPTEYRDRAGRA
ncbi:Cache domain-containing protein [Paenibacillus sp. UNCCL117]|uniref:cache domain-containing protein n=1 Tax=unclassified Paenibacillus TaxID=185978 RepID=UPI000884E504|nr:MULTISPECIES: helix-turn-helix domain-containing protein [unclassified Paenibacillus]SDD50403.1 Cache domain-containing protein [Paenibacillus sp. cl123]SFW49733.1 Cache domain-containing protein [Paenibacillus sp. UNCCL117]